MSAFFLSLPPSRFNEGSLTLSYTVGVPVTRAFLSSAFYPSQINRVVVLTRDATSAKAQELQSLGAEIYDGTVDANALQGIDVVVNTYSQYSDSDVSENLAKAAAEAGVKVYFPSEYGMCVSSPSTYTERWY